MSELTTRGSKLLCWLGIHQWRKWTLFPIDGHGYTTKRCYKCAKDSLEHITWIKDEVSRLTRELKAKDEIIQQLLDSQALTSNTQGFMK